MHKKQVGSVGGALIQINGFSWPVTYIASANIMGSVFSSQALVLTASTARRKCRGIFFLPAEAELLRFFLSVDRLLHHRS